MNIFLKTEGVFRLPVTKLWAISHYYKEAGDMRLQTGAEYCCMMDMTCNKSNETGCDFQQ